MPAPIVHRVHSEQLQHAPQSLSVYKDARLVRTRGRHRTRALGGCRLKCSWQVQSKYRAYLNDDRLPYSLHLGRRCRTEEYRRFSGGHLQRPEKVLCIHPAHSNSNNW